MCYYCKHGLPDPVKAIFDELDEYFPNSFNPFGHIVLEDSNLGDGSIDFCLNLIEEWRQGKRPEIESWEGLAMATETALLRLMSLSEEDRKLAEADEDWELAHRARGEARKLAEAVAKFGGTLTETEDGYVANFYDPALDDCGIILRFPDSRFDDVPTFDTPTAGFEDYIAKALHEIRGGK